MYFVPLESENKCVQHVKAGCWYIMLSHLFGNKSWHHPWLHAVSDDITVHTTSLGFLIWLECNLRRENSLECVLNYDDVYARLEITLYSLRLKTANEPMVSPKGAGPWLALRPWIDTGLLALDWQWVPGLTQGCWSFAASDSLDPYRGTGSWVLIQPPPPPPDPHRGAGPWLQMNPQINKKGKENCSKNILCENILLLT